MKKTILFCLMAAATVARGAVVYTENFENIISGANGWGNRAGGLMSVSGPSSLGSPASQALQGSFAASGSPLITDAFNISSGGNFVGDYTSLGVGGLTQFKFDLYAENAVPSDLFIYLVSGGVDYYSYQLNLSGMVVDSWRTFTVNLDGVGWSGPGDFSTALGSVSEVQSELTRNGTSAQAFYLDNIQTLDGPVSGSSAVPEPNTLLMLSLAGAGLFSFRRYLSRTT